MKSILANKYLLFTFRLILGFIFIYAGVEKISDPAGFAGSINNYRFFPEFTINFFAIVVPWIEVTSGILLIFGIAVRENSFIISSMLVFFILLISIGILRGLDISCGCFGTHNSQSIGLSKIVENLLTFIPGLLLMLYDSEFLSLK